MAAKKIRKTTADERAFYTINYIYLGIMTIIVLFPLLNILAQSFSSPNEVIGGRVVLWPRGFTLFAYRGLLRSPSVAAGYFNTLLYMIAGTCLNLLMTLICAYPLSRAGFYGKNVFMFIFTFTMLFGGGMIPNYLLIKDLGLIDSRLVMILPGAMSVWNMILARTFFASTIPNELYESAEIDGASHIRMLLSIAIPLSGPIIAVLALFYAVGHWNSYFDAMLYLKTPRLFNIQLILRNALQNINAMLDGTGITLNQLEAMGIAEVSKYAMIVITMIPVLAIYPFVQKFFIKGVMIGSIKG